MQSTLIKIGNQILADQSELAEIISIPNIPLKNKKDETLSNKALNIIFDLDENEIIIDAKNIEAYDRENSPFDLWHVNSDLWGRRGNLRWLRKSGHEIILNLCSDERRKIKEASSI